MSFQEVKLSKDVAHGTAYWTSWNEEMSDQAEKALNTLAPLLRHALTTRLSQYVHRDEGGTKPG